jgi:hypothetical protein
MLYLDALTFIGVYVLRRIRRRRGGRTVRGERLGQFCDHDMFILDRLSMQVGVVRSVYLRTW